mgnify:CR=1 FL=1
MKIGIMSTMTVEKIEMLVNYNKLWKMLIDRHMTKTQMRLSAGLSTVTLAKLNKGRKVRNSTIDRICEALQCKQKDIMCFAKGKVPKSPVNNAAGKNSD